MRWFIVAGAALSLALLTGCANERTILITSNPPGARVRIDGIDQRGTTPMHHSFTFGDNTRYDVQALLPGYDPARQLLDDGWPTDELKFNLSQKARVIEIQVEPPASLTVDGQPVTEGVVGKFSKEFRFPARPDGTLQEHTVVAQRPHYQTHTERIVYTSPGFITIPLKPQPKNLIIRTTPPGAEVLLDDKPKGATGPGGLPIYNQTFDINPDPNPAADTWRPKWIEIRKDGYATRRERIGWDDGKTDYAFDLTPLSKTVRITATTQPFEVTIDGNKYPSGRDGVATIPKLEFNPAPGTEGPRVYEATVASSAARDDWKPAKLTIGYEEGRQDYHAALREVLGRTVRLITAEPRQRGDRWELVPRTIETRATKFTDEGIGKEAPQPITRDLPGGSVVDSLTVSPDGTRVLFTVFTGTDPGDFRSRLLTVRSDGTGAFDRLTDGGALELTPTYSPDGQQIVFASNRDGGRIKICQIPSSGRPGVTALTSGESLDLWPSMDSDPNPRVYYQAMVKSEREPRLYATRQRGAPENKEFAHHAGGQPRVSPLADSVVFTYHNQATRRDEIWLWTARGGETKPLVKDPDSNNRDPAWSPDGSKIAFASDRADTPDDEGGRVSNYDVWVIDLEHPEHPRQITTNPGWDDSPAWDATGNYLFFRSNRGGKWGVWKVGQR